MKRFIGTAAVLAALMVSNVMAGESISLKINGTELECEVPPQIIDGRTMVPVRAIFEAVGAEVNWDSDTKTVTGIKGDTTVEMTVDSRTEFINGEAVEMDAAPVVTEGRTLAPARYVAEAFGCSVEWDAENKAVNIGVIDSEVAETDTETTTESTTETVTEDTDDEYISFFTEKSNKPAAIDTNKIKDDELVMLYEDTRYNFEQQTLPQYLFENSDEMAQLIKNDSDAFEEKVMEEWNSNMAVGILGYALGKGSVEIPEECDFYLKPEENMGLITGKLNDDTYLSLIEMADDDTMLSCAYIGIVYSDDEGFRYYTLEKSFDNLYAVCQIDENSRGNFGMIEDSENNKEIFIEFIKSVDGDKEA